MKKPLKWIIPLSAVAIVAVVAAVALILHLSGPDPVVYEPGTVIYQDEQVTAKVVESLNPRKSIFTSFMSMTEEEVFDIHPIIATGTVKNIREVEISFFDLGRPSTRVVTLFDFHIGEYLKNISPTNDNRSVLTVGLMYSSYQWAEEIPTMQENDIFLLFLEDLEINSSLDIMQRKEYADAWIYAPNFLAVKQENGIYSIDQEFQNYLDDVQKQTASTKLVEIVKQKVSEHQEVG